MKNMQYTHLEEDEFSTFLGEDVELRGLLEADSVLLKGTMNNSVVRGSLVFIESKGIVNGEINTSYLVISGVVDGKVFVSENLHVLHGGEIRGEVKSTDIVVDKGAKLNATCSMVTREALEKERKEVSEEGS